MANITFSTALPKLQCPSVMAVRSPWSSSRLSMPVTTRHIRASSQQEASAAAEKASKAVKQGVNEAKLAGQDLKDNAASKKDEITQRAGDDTGKVAGTIEDLTESAKQTAEDAWGSIKDTTEKIKDTVAGKTEEATDIVKENAEVVKDTVNEKVKVAKDIIKESADSVKRSMN